MLVSFLRVCVVAVICTGCLHWSRVEELDDVVGASRVRIEPPDAPAHVLDHPTVAEVREAAESEHAHVSVEKLNGVAVGAIAGGVTLSVAATIIPFVILALIPRPVPVFASP